MNNCLITITINNQSHTLSFSSKAQVLNWLLGMRVTKNSDDNCWTTNKGNKIIIDIIETGAPFAEHAMVEELLLNS